MLAMILPALLGVASCGWLNVPPAGPGAGVPEGISLEQLTVGGVQRSYFVYTPPAWRDQPKRKFPAVVLFHGAGDEGGQRGKVIAANTLLHEEANRRGFVAVYPNAADGIWWTHPNMVEGKNHDLPYVEAMLDGLVARYRVDPERVAVTGFSAGGHMAQVTACRLPERVSALAWVGASVLDLTPAYCGDKASKPVPSLMYVGSDDPINPYRGGKVNSSIVSARPELQIRLEVLSAKDSLAYWGRRNGCDGATTEELLPNKVVEDGTRVRRDRFAACPAAAPVELLTCEGGAHTWPGGAAKADKCGDLPMTRYMLDFFESAGFRYGGGGGGQAR